MIYLELFLVYFRIGLFSFGGGYAAMPLIQSLIVEGKHWLTMEEYADLTAIAEMTPGPIAVNSATFVGQKMAGLPGALVCTFGCILPSLIIVMALAWLYTKIRNFKIVQDVLKKLRPAVTAMIAGACLTILLMALFGTSTLSEIPNSSLRFIELILYIVSLILIRKFNFGPITIIGCVTVVGTVLYLIF